MKDNTVVLYAKYPEPGSVKTRLAKGTPANPAGIGHEAAARIYEAFLRDEIVKFGQSNDFDLRICVAQDRLNDFQKLFGDTHTYHPDAFNGDLGASLTQTLTSLLSDAGYKRVVIMGSDIPHLPLSEIATAFDTLDDCDLVLGPDAGGGIYLIGMNQPHDILSDIAWGQGTDFEAVRDRAERNDLRVGLLRKNYDIDNIDDLRRLYEMLKDPQSKLRIELPTTFRALEQTEFCWGST